MKRIQYILLIAMCLSGCASQQETTIESRPLTYFTSNEYATKKFYNELDETDLKYELERKTGIKIKFIQPKSMTMEAELTTMIASSDLPDIIEYPWESYGGGPEKAMQDEIIIPLNQVIKAYSPNFSRYILENPDMVKPFMTDDGMFYAYPFIKNEDNLKKYKGPVLREDWLKELGLEAPRTLDEWEHVLREFKTKKYANAPAAFRLSDFSYGFISGAYGLTTSYYNDNGVIKYGPYEERFKDFLERMAQWYSEGLLDKNFLSMSSEMIGDQIKNRKSGAAFLSIGDEMGKIMSKTDNISLIGVQYPVLNAGDKITFSAYDNGQANVAISSSCYDIPAAAKFLDYGYSKEGMLTYNFGIEGESYVLENGKPIYTDVIKNNPDYDMHTIMGNYMRGQYNGPFIQMEEYQYQYFSYPQQKEASKLWSSIPSDMTVMPRVSFKGEEINEMIELKASVESYTSDMIIRFITGIRPISEFEDFREELHQRGVERAIDIYQRAYERFINREVKW